MNKTPRPPERERTLHRGWRHLSALRFTEVRTLDDGVEFDAVDTAGNAVRFAIDAETLALLSGRREVGALATVFDENLALIRGVASRVFDAGARGSTIRLHASMFGVR